MSKLYNIANIQGTAKLAEGEAPELGPIEGLKGWSLSAYTAEDAGLDFIVLACEANADTNPLHSGGDVYWLGYVAEGKAELLLGNESGKQDSSKMVSCGDYVMFEPDTYHGWVPQGEPTKLLFIKLKG